MGKVIVKTYTLEHIALIMHLASKDIKDEGLAKDLDLYSRIIFEMVYGDTYSYQDWIDNR